MYKFKILQTPNCKYVFGKSSGVTPGFVYRYFQNGKREKKNMFFSNMEGLIFLVIKKLLVKILFKTVKIMFKVDGLRNILFPYNCKLPFHIN